MNQFKSLREAYDWCLANAKHGHTVDVNGDPYEWQLNWGKHDPFLMPRHRTSFNG